MYLQALSERARARADMCRQATATQLRVQQLEEELRHVKEEAALEKKCLEDEMQVKETQAVELVKSACRGNAVICHVITMSAFVVGADTYTTTRCGRQGREAAGRPQEVCRQSHGDKGRPEGG